MLGHIEPKLASEILTTLPCKINTERVSVYSALGRVLSADMYSVFPSPPFNKSSFDGYALRSADCPGRMRISREVAAGNDAGPTLGECEAVRIFTGSPVPAGADLVLKQEDVMTENGFVTVEKFFAPDTNVIHIGEDYVAGSLLIKAGTILTAGAIGVLSSQGHSTLPVFAKPSAAIISTGSELAEPGFRRPEYGIYNSSAAAICAFLQGRSIESKYMGIVPDNAEVIAKKTNDALNCCDLVITTGGASVGDYDFALATAKAVDAEPLFWKVNMKPGGAILASVKNGKLLLNLSGNPAAAMMGLIVVVSPYLKKLCGETILMPEKIRLPLKYALPKTSAVTRLLRGHLEICEGAAILPKTPVAAMVIFPPSMAAILSA